MDDLQAPEVPGFALRRLLGKGSSAAVWLASDQRTGRDVALKVFFPPSAGGGAIPEGCASPEESVRREIRILSVLDHQHLVKARDAVRCGPWPQGSGVDSTALVMDYASGGSLGHLLASRGRLSVGETVTVLTPVAQALSYLHGKGFTHGDVSPGNVLFTGQGKPMVSDLGIARMLGDPAGGAGHGTAGFLDPMPVDAVRAGLQPERDVYSAAAIGWFCLTGAAPARTADRPPLPLLVPDVPRELAAALEAGLDEDRRLRPTAAALATAVYRSAAPVPLDLSGAVHPTVIPELLTRRQVPASSSGNRLREGFGRLHRRLATAPGFPKRQIPSKAQPLSPPHAGAAPGPGRSPEPRVPQPTGGGAGVPGRGGKHVNGPLKQMRRSALAGSPRGKAPAGTGSDRTGPKITGLRIAGLKLAGPERTGSARTAAHRSAQARTAAEKTARVRTAPPSTHRLRPAVLASGAAAAAVVAALLVLGFFGGLQPVGDNAAAVDASVLLHGDAAAGQGSPKQEAGPGPGQKVGPGPGQETGQGPGVGTANGPAAAGAEAEARQRASSDDPAEALQGLAALRDRAFNSGQPGMLAEVNAGGSPAAAADQATADRLLDSGHVLAGFTSTLSGVRTEAGATESRAVVKATAATSAWEERDAAGSVAASGPAAPGRTLRLVLVAVDGQWRISEILPGP